MEVSKQRGKSFLAVNIPDPLTGFVLAKLPLYEEEANESAPEPAPED